MRILIVTHAARGSTKGNRITAERWAHFLTQSGHDARIENDFAVGSADTDEWDCLIALHATRSNAAIKAFASCHPTRPILLCLTGTDLHADLQGLRSDKARTMSRESIQRASRLILLEPEGIKQLPADAREKVVVILQSAVPVPETRPPRDDTFELVIIGHLRDEKDPFLAARASRQLPADSRIRLLHLGDALTGVMQHEAQREQSENARYRWLGGLSHNDTMAHLVASRAMVLTSKIEGAPSVISEAIVNRVPILTTRIPATIGLLGADYPAMFSVGDVDALAVLMLRIEQQPKFRSTLQQAVNAMADRFAPDTERNALAKLVSQSKV